MNFVHLFTLLHVTDVSVWLQNSNKCVIADVLALFTIVTCGLFIAIVMTCYLNNVNAAKKQHQNLQIYVSVLCRTCCGEY